MASFRNRNNRWQAIVRRGEQRAQYRSFRTKKEAQDWATSIEDAINRTISLMRLFASESVEGENRSQTTLIPERLDD